MERELGLEAWQGGVLDGGPEAGQAGRNTPVAGPRMMKIPSRKVAKRRNIPRATGLKRVWQR
jgi:hypothetical protein